MSTNVISIATCLGIIIFRVVVQASQLEHLETDINIENQALAPTEIAN
jgi:hypothetical protein